MTARGLEVHAQELERQLADATARIAELEAGEALREPPTAHGALCRYLRRQRGTDWELLDDRARADEIICALRGAGFAVVRMEG